jgi:hypothetical protein
MRITIDTDDKGKVNIDTGDTGNEKPGLFESTIDIPVIDAGPAPVQEIEQRARKVDTATEVSSVSESQSPQDREAQLPLNPLRAGAAAAYQDPANLRKRAPDFEGTAAAQDPSITTIDAGSAKVPKDKKSSDVPTPEQQSPKGAQRDKKR